MNSIIQTPNSYQQPQEDVIKLYQAKPPTPLEVLWHDPWLIAVNKPANELSVPGKPPLDQFATQLRVARLCGQAYVIHRLDGATSGVILFARNSWVQRHMHWAFRYRWVKKKYCALIEGKMPMSCGTIDLPLGRDWPNRPRQKIDWGQGKPSLTHWRQIQNFSTLDFSRVELRPVTGRSHQLRVHLLALGHPILGDRLYHDTYIASTANRHLQPRLHLHAQELSFHHPVTGQYLTLQAHCPF